MQARVTSTRAVRSPAVEPDGEPIIDEESREMSPKVQEQEMQVLHALASMPFADTLELAVILGEAYTTVHRAPSGLLADGIAARVNHGTVHLPGERQMVPDD